MDAEAMARALDDGRISWYATDVYPEEPPAADYPSLACKNVTLTPHIGANTEENLLRISDEAVALIADLIKGGKL